ncbi:hypothetical protein RclHR1_10890001 [Rhizophagus clarus]|uniref:F-box domain-containing protein n=1 Tax=Rhizophagus clarus TaxID=94130 RepID=A0A2Z6QHI6_9GLOM|nr:hypothetical protein RclHR1_10890001 [Rhizophagus clarus]GES90106.1 hypothetical protein GLOIN_2v1886013 [Rhizophagus clarus]
MSKLNTDVLYLIIKEFHNDGKTLYSCLSVNKTWCEIIIPILWNNPWKYLNYVTEQILLNKIISHLPEESRNNLINRGIKLPTNCYIKPLFNYISFCRHLNINKIERIIDNSRKKSPRKKSYILNEIIHFFINENTKFTHLYIPEQFSYQIHLIPGAEHCFSEVESLSCNTRINDNVFDGIIDICKSIRELELHVNNSDNIHRISKLIENPKKLFNVRLLLDNPYFLERYESFRKIIENSLIKHANTVQHFGLFRLSFLRILSVFDNLISLDLNGDNYGIIWDCFETMSISLPSLQILKTRSVPIRPLIRLIENTGGNLNEIITKEVLYDSYYIHSEKIIRAIYTKCPKIKYLKLEFKYSDILELEELEKLLINCQHLDGLFFDQADIYNWDNLFEILTKSSPDSLFKFKFHVKQRKRNVQHDSLKLFFDNWKGKRPLLLQFNKKKMEKYSDLIEKYKAEGVVKKFDYNICYEDFEWF